MERQKIIPLAEETKAAPLGPNARPEGTVLIYTCNKCGKQSFNRAWMWIHQYREHGIENREEMDIVKRPAWVGTKTHIAKDRRDDILDVIRQQVEKERKNDSH